jgi:hypothetical protein
MAPHRIRFVAAVMSVAATVSWRAYVQTQSPDSPRWRVPEYRFDPDWPKPLPEVKDAEGVARPQWTGGVAWVCVDTRNDHIVQLNRAHVEQMPAGMNAVKAAPIIIRDYGGNAIGSIGDLSLSAEGRSKVLPQGSHGCAFDEQGNIWIGGNSDGVVQKWSLEGKLLLQIGEKGVCDGPPTLSPRSPFPTCGAPGFGMPGFNASKTLLNEPAKAAVDPNPDPVTHERGSVYIADGYGNHRVVVFDSRGKYLRQWGSMGTGPGQFFFTGGGHPHCIMLGTDNLVYVCDRNGNRLQVFDKFGNLKRVMYFMPLGEAANEGSVTAYRSVSDIAFSRDPQQKFIFVLYTGVLDGTQGGGRILIVDHKTGAVVGQVGGPGKEPGMFITAHGLSIDSKGNLYVAESTPGNRLQRFIKIRN